MNVPVFWSYLKLSTIFSDCYLLPSVVLLWTRDSQCTFMNKMGEWHDKWKRDMTSDQKCLMYPSWLTSSLRRIGSTSVWSSSSEKIFSSVWGTCWFSWSRFLLPWAAYDMRGGWEGRTMKIHHKCNSVGENSTFKAGKTLTSTANSWLQNSPCQWIKLFISSQPSSLLLLSASCILK